MSSTLSCPSIPMATAMFSTDLGARAARMDPDPLDPLVLHSNPQVDRVEMASKLRRKWPVQCRDLSLPINLTDYFDYHDIHVLGGRFLWDVLNEIHIQNVIENAKPPVHAQKFHPRQQSAYSDVPEDHTGTHPDGGQSEENGAPVIGQGLEPERTQQSQTTEMRKPHSPLHDVPPIHSGEHIVPRATSHTPGYSSSWMKPANTLYVGNLPEYVAGHELFDIFVEFGPIICIRIKGQDREPSRGQFGFVEFSKHDDAADARFALRRFNMRGNIIKVDWKSPSPPFWKRSCGSHSDRGNGAQSAKPLQQFHNFSTFPGLAFQRPMPDEIYPIQGMSRMTVMEKAQPYSMATFDSSQVSPKQRRSAMDIYSPQDARSTPFPYSQSFDTESGEVVLSGPDIEQQGPITDEVPTTGGHSTTSTREISGLEHPERDPPRHHEKPENNLEAIKAHVGIPKDPETTSNIGDSSLQDPTRQHQSHLENTENLKATTSPLCGPYSVSASKRRETMSSPRDSNLDDTESEPSSNQEKLETQLGATDTRVPCSSSVGAIKDTRNELGRDHHDDSLKHKTRSVKGVSKASSQAVEMYPSGGKGNQKADKVIAPAVLRIDENVKSAPTVPLRFPAHLKPERATETKALKEKKYSTTTAPASSCEQKAMETPQDDATTRMTKVTSKQQPKQQDQGSKPKKSSSRKKKNTKSTSQSIKTVFKSTGGAEPAEQKDLVGETPALQSRSAFPELGQEPISRPNTSDKRKMAGGKNESGGNVAEGATAQKKEQTKRKDRRTYSQALGHQSDDKSLEHAKEAGKEMIVGAGSDNTDKKRATKDGGKD
ncbi:MAG: hypothetical protein M1837_002057 [Sclerophora amabilis]|nr:MAG: hypothetical protein M1837_002057 [Sclerophora amabilis]